MAWTRSDRRAVQRCSANERGRSVDAPIRTGAPVDDLLIAAGADRVDVLASHLARGADVNARFDHGWTAVHAAAVTGRVHAVEFLLQRGADASVREERFGGTAASNARYNGLNETAELIERSSRTG